MKGVGKGVGGGGGFPLGRPPPPPSPGKTTLKKPSLIRVKNLEDILSKLGTFDESRQAKIFLIVSNVA